MIKPTAQPVKKGKTPESKKLDKKTELTVHKPLIRIM